jgi:CO/xanthine dehydrogenase Mo-binding subunit
MEGAGAVCSFDRSTGRMTVHSNSNMLNFAAWVISGTLKIAPELIEFHPMYTGGSFGSKHFTAKVIALAGSMSMLTGRPVKFMEDRADNLLANSSQAPDRHYEAALAIDADGKFLSVKYDVIDDYGAYFCFAVAGNTNAMAQSTGPYDMGSCETAVKAVLTNKNQQGVFRGAGSEVSNWVLERLVDAAAAELGIDGIELRRRNLIQPDQFPYKIPTGNVYDSGDYPAVLEKALAHADLDYWRAEQERGREQGRYIGIGFAQAQQRSTYASTEFWFHNPGPYVGMSTTPESVRLSSGRPAASRDDVLAVLGQLARDRRVARRRRGAAGRPRPSVSITYDSTAHGLPSAGPGGSRLTVMLVGRRARRGAKVREKMFAIAAHQLEASPEDMELADGVVRVRGVADPARSLSIADIGMKAYWYKNDLPEGMESGLEGSFTYDHPYTTLPNDDGTDLGVFYPIMGHAVHVVVVEVDVRTGHVHFLKYLAVHDVGTGRQPALAARPDSRRHRDGDRRHADGADPPRRRRSRAVGVLRGLPAAARRRRAERRGAAPRDAVAVHRLWRQGRRRGRPDGRPAARSRPRSRTR